MAKVLEDGERFVLTALDTRILCALLSRPLSGYDIARQCEEDSGLDKGTVAHGSVMPSLGSLSQLYLVREVGNDGAPNAGKPRRVFKITRLGRQVLQWELDSWRRLLWLADERRDEAQAHEKDPG